MLQKTVYTDEILFIVRYLWLSSLMTWRRITAQSELQQIVLRVSMIIVRTDVKRDKKL